MKNTKLRSNENRLDLFFKLLLADKEEEVIDILENYGFDIYDDSSWFPLGGNEGNFSTIGNQQEEGTSALVEKLVNSIDAVLLSACHESSISPESQDAPQTMSAAVEKFFNVRDGRLDKLSSAEQRELANYIHMVATGSKRNPSYSVIDLGEGQTPNNFKNTFLSATTKSPKVRIPFVQGKYNAGSTGSLQFCGKQNIQLIVSKSHPNAPITASDDSSDHWGFTIIRRRRPRDSGERSSVFKYLAPGGEILRFKSDTLDLLPEKSSKNNPGEPYKKPLKYGTCVKLYEYKWPGKSLATLEGKRRIEKYLQLPCLPIRIHESRQDYKANYFSTTVTGIWNQFQVDDAGQAKSLEPGFPCDDEINIEEFGTLPIKIAVWREDIEHKTTGVYFLKNGQVHGSFQQDFISRSLNFDYIKNDILIRVDCTEMNVGVGEDLFMASRDRLRKNDEYKELRSKLAEQLRDHPGLKELNALRKKKAREDAIKNNDDVVEIFNQLVNKDPSIARLLGFGGQVHGGVGPGDPSVFIGNKFPTFFKLAKSPQKGLVKLCPINRTVKLEFETDAENEYFSRPDEPGEISVVPSPSLIESQRLWNGNYAVRFRVPWDAKPGDKFVVRFEVSDITRVAKGPFVNEFTIKAAEPAKEKKKVGGKRNPKEKLNPDDPSSTTSKYNVPQPIEVKKESWQKHTHNFTSTKSIEIKRSGDDEFFDFYINVDCKYLISEISQSKLDTQLIKSWYMWGLTLAAISMIKEAEEQSKVNDESDSIDLSSIESACNGLGRVIIPIINTLHDLPLSKVV